MRHALLASLVAVALAWAGCARPAEETETPAGLAGDVPDTAPPAGGPTPATPSPSTSPGNGSASPGSSPSTGGNGTGPKPETPASAVYAPGWPSLDAAKIRPGIQVNSAGGQCTSNFVYASRDNLTLYIGIAAHCVEGMKLGDALDIGGVAKGTLAYSSWLLTGWTRTGPTPNSAQGECSIEKNAEICDYNDFALVRIANESRGMVHPAMRHFGGPVSLANHSSVAMLDKVITYGNSGLRAQTEPLAWHEGYVTGQFGWTTSIVTVGPGVPGDSGSGVMLGDGRALGILVTLGAGENGVTSLDLALQYAREKAGLDVVLATWGQIDPGLFP